MFYVLDTGFFIAVREYYRKVFPSFWENMDEAAASDRISSVREVCRELVAYGGNKSYMDEWVGVHKRIFTEPNSREVEAVREILAIRSFDSLIKAKAIRKGTPVADPLVIAKAWVTSATVVTRELSAKTDKNQKFPQHPHIPDVCGYFGIPCLTPMEFMEEEEWKF